MIQAIKNHTPKIHKNAFVHERATVIGNVEIAEGASIWPSAVLRGDMGAIRIGKNTSIQDGTTIHMTKGFSQTIIGDNVTVGHNVILHGCVVENNCLIGMGSILLDNAKISQGSFVAAGSLVTGQKIFDSNMFIIGAPAKALRKVNEKEQAMINMSVEHYLEAVKLYDN